MIDARNELPHARWGTGHIEQNETFSGSLSVAGRAVDLHGVGWRDHSWGPRDFTRAEPLRRIPLAFLGTSQIGIGAHGRPEAHHEWAPSFSRFTWDGETGYGCVERSRTL